MRLTPEQLGFLREATGAYRASVGASISQSDLLALESALKHRHPIEGDPRLLHYAIRFLDESAMVYGFPIPNRYRGHPLANQTLAALRQAKGELLGAPPPLSVAGIFSTSRRAVGTALALLGGKDTPLTTRLRSLPGATGSTHASSPEPMLVEVDVSGQMRTIFGKHYVLLTFEQFRQLPDGVQLTAIDGERVTIGRDRVNMDVKGRFLAYGIPLEEIRTLPRPGTTLRVAITDGVARPAPAMLPPPSSRGLATVESMAFVAASPITLPRALAKIVMPEQVYAKMSDIAMSGLGLLVGDLGSDLLLGRRDALKKFSVRNLVANYAALTIGSEVIGRPIAAGAAAFLNEGLLKVIMQNSVSMMAALTVQEWWQTGAIDVSQLPGRMVRLRISTGIVHGAIAAAARSAQILRAAEGLRLVTTAGKCTVLGALILSVADLTVYKVIEDATAHADTLIRRRAIADGLAELVQQAARTLHFAKAGYTIDPKDLAQLDREMGDTIEFLRHEQSIPELGTLFTRLPIDHWRNLTSTPVDEDLEKADVDMDGNPLHSDGYFSIHSLIAQNPKAQVQQMQQMRHDFHEALSAIGGQNLFAQEEPRDLPSAFVALPSDVI